MRLDLHPSIRINVSHFRVPEPEYIQKPVVSVNITRHRSPYDQKSVLSLGKRQPAESRQVSDEVSGAVVGR